MGELWGRRDSTPVIPAPLEQAGTHTSQMGWAVGLLRNLPQQIKWSVIKEGTWDQPLVSTHVPEPTKVWMRMTPVSSHVGATILSWWNCLGRIGKYSLIGGGVRLGAGFEASKARCLLCLLPSEVTSQLLLPTMRPACCHVSCHDGNACLFLWVWNKAFFCKLRWSQWFFFSHNKEWLIQTFTGNVGSPQIV